MCQVRRRITRIIHLSHGCTYEYICMAIHKTHIINNNIPKSKLVNEMAVHTRHYTHILYMYITISLCNYQC